jgi:transposase-like protein
MTAKLTPADREAMLPRIDLMRALGMADRQIARELEISKDQLYRIVVKSRATIARPRIHRGLCPVCGYEATVKDGAVAGHLERRVGPSGMYVSKQRCEGKGKPPE